MQKVRLDGIIGYMKTVGVQVISRVKNILLFLCNGQIINRGSFFGHKVQTSELANQY